MEKMLKLVTCAILKFIFYKKLPALKQRVAILMIKTMAF